MPHITTGQCFCPVHHMNVSVVGKYNYPEDKSREQTDCAEKIMTLLTQVNNDGIAMARDKVHTITKRILQFFMVQSCLDCMG